MSSFKNQPQVVNIGIKLPSATHGPTFRFEIATRSLYQGCFKHAATVQTEDMMDAFTKQNHTMGNNDAEDVFGDL